MYNKKLAKEFCRRLITRLDDGHKKYKDDYFLKDLGKDTEEELLDIANYALLQYMKIKEVKDKLYKNIAINVYLNGCLAKHVSYIKEGKIFITIKK